MNEDNELELKENDICSRCNKNKAVMIFAQSMLDYGHGFGEKICQECYDKQIKESDWYKKGFEDGKQECQKMFNSYKKIQPDCEKCGNELKIYESDEGTSGWCCPVCDKERQLRKMFKNTVEKLKYCIRSGIHVCSKNPEDCDLVINYDELKEFLGEEK